MASSCPPAEHPSVPSLDRARLITSTWHTLEQPPPPSLREILGAYRLKGDGDRDMLMAMLNAKTAEDQRIAAVASLHKTLLDLCSTDASTSLAPLQQYPLSSSHLHPSRHPPGLSHAHHSAHHSTPSPREPPPRKRQRSSRSPARSPTHLDARSHPLSRDLPPSPYSSRSDSEEYSPKSRAPMAIGSLLSSGTVPHDPRHTPEHAQTRLSSSAVGVSV